MRHTLWLAALAWGVAACAPAPNELDGAWQVQQIFGASLHAEERIHFTIEGDAISGSTGCNRFTGAVRQFEQMVTIANVSTTEMACPNEAAATNEARFLGVLPSVRRYVRHGARLELLGEAGAPDALILARAEAATE